MGENLHKDNLEDFFQKSFSENEQGSTSDDWDLPDDKVWEGISNAIQEEPTKVVPMQAFVWKKWLGVAASFLIFTLAYCVYQDHQKLNGIAGKLEELQEYVPLNSNKETAFPIAKTDSEESSEASLPLTEDQKKNGNIDAPANFNIVENNAESFDRKIEHESSTIIEKTQAKQGVVSLPQSISPNKKNTQNTINHISTKKETTVSQSKDEIVSIPASGSDNIGTTITNQETTTTNKIFDDKSNLKNPPVVQKENITPYVSDDKGTDNISIANTNQDNISEKSQDKWEAIPSLNTDEIILLDHDINFAKIKYDIKQNPALIIKNRTPLDVKFSLGLVQGFHKIGHTLKGNRLQPAPSRNHKGQHYAYTTGIVTGIHFNEHFSIESGIAMGIQNSNLRIRGRRHPFPRPEEEIELPEDQGFESRTSIPYYSGTSVAETDIVITRPENVQPDRFQAFNLDFHIKNQRRFLRIPLRLKYTSKSFGPAKFTASAGIVGNIDLKQTVEVKSQSSDQRELAVRVETAPPTQTAKMSYDFVVGAGIELPLASNWTISLEPSFSKGLTKVKPEIGSNVTTNTVNVELGARYRF